MYFQQKVGFVKNIENHVNLDTFVRKGVLILRPLSFTAKYLHEQENFAQGFKLLFGKSHQYTLM